MSSIYHFFADLVNKKSNFLEGAKLEEFPFDDALLSCQNSGVFPDLAIRLSDKKPPFCGGELIELKDSKSFGLPSFNSTIPTGEKLLKHLIHGGDGVIGRQMELRGDDLESLPVRQVFYLIRGTKKGRVKVCLVHGSFFETVAAATLIKNSFASAITQASEQENISLSEAEKGKILAVFSRQEYFSRVQTVDKASVKLRFRVMTEARAEGNILNGNQYPAIGGDTLNLVIPAHDETAEAEIMKHIVPFWAKKTAAKIKFSKIKHHFNGWFMAFQTPLKD